MEFDTNLLLFKDKAKTTESPPHLLSDAYLNQLNSPSYIEQVTAEIIAKEAHVARSSAIKYQNASIMALAGQEITTKDLKTNIFWETDPYPNLESTLLHHRFDPIGGKASFFGGEAKLWQYLTDTAKEISKETNNLLNIYNLTPTEAVFLIKELIRRRLNYDDVISKDINQEKIDNNEVKTANPNILSHFSKNQKKYISQRDKYITKVNVKKADQIIKHGYAVCRHVAAVSSVLYEVLRSKQQNILMNGSHLIYHDERYGNQKSKASVGMHSYNVLYTTHPTGSVPEIYISIVDPTFILGTDYEDANPDQTNSRVSQACSSLYEYGDFFGLHNTKETVKNLALIALNRIKKSSSPKVDFNDYISLEYQAAESDSVKALNSIFLYLTKCGNTPVTILTNLLQNPPVAYENVKYKYSLRKKWLPGIIDQISKLKINSNAPTENNTFLEILAEHATQISTEEILEDSTGNLWKLLTVYRELSIKIDKQTLATNNSY